MCALLIGAVVLRLLVPAATRYEDCRGKERDEKDSATSGGFHHRLLSKGRVKPLDPYMFLRNTSPGVSMEHGTRVTKPQGLASTFRRPRQSAVRLCHEGYGDTSSKRMSSGVRKDDLDAKRVVEAGSLCNHPEQQGALGAMAGGTVTIETCGTTSTGRGRHYNGANQDEYQEVGISLRFSLARGELRRLGAGYGSGKERFV